MSLLDPRQNVCFLQSQQKTSACAYHRHAHALYPISEMSGASWSYVDLPECEVHRHAQNVLNAKSVAEKVVLHPGYPRSCEVCGAWCTTRCSRCRHTKYCSSACQRLDLAVHGPTCTRPDVRHRPVLILIDHHKPISEANWTRINGWIPEWLRSGVRPDDIRYTWRDGPILQPTWCDGPILQPKSKPLSWIDAQLLSVIAVQAGRLDTFQTLMRLRKPFHAEGRFTGEISYALGSNLHHFVGNKMLANKRLANHEQMIRDWLRCGYSINNHKINIYQESPQAFDPCEWLEMWTNTFGVVLADWDPDHFAFCVSYTGLHRRDILKVIRCAHSLGMRQPRTERLCAYPATIDEISVWRQPFVDRVPLVHSILIQILPRDLISICVTY